MKVKAGDTLSGIAKKNGTTLKAILAANPNIKNANQIRVGQTIKMPQKQMSPGDAQRNPYKGTTRSELKGIDSEKQSKKNPPKGKGESVNDKERSKKRARVATRMQQLRAAAERNK